MTMIMELNCLSIRAILLWCLISLALSRRRMILFTLNSPIVQFQLNSSFQLPCQLIYKFSLLVRKRVLFSSNRLGKFRKIIFWQTIGWRRNKQPDSIKLLKYKFCGFSAADNFPLKLLQNILIIVNVSSSDSIWTHWTLLCRKNGNYTFADPLGQKLTSYKYLYNRLASAALDVQNVYELRRNQPIQTQNSILYGWFCS